MLIENQAGNQSLKINLVLSEINDFSNQSDSDIISDLINLSIPFSDKSSFGKSNKKFVVFDTPGANSASNVKHYQVLKQAMENLSNGLAIFVSDYDSLDTNDADKLSDEIKNIDALDSRFTMIVVNKADASDLKNADNKNAVLRQAIPQKIYSGGLYFASSIIALGNRIDAEFIEEHPADIYDSQFSRYSNPKSRFYKQLYLNNILPNQIKRRYYTMSENEEDLIYVNSGFFEIDQALQDFSTKYTAYNKCHQANLFFGKIIDITHEEISKATQEKEAHLENVKRQLEKKQKELIEQIEIENKNLKKKFIEEYFSEMENLISDESGYLSRTKLEEIEALHRKKAKSENKLEEKKQKIGEDWKKGLVNIGEKVQNFDIKGTFSEVGNGIEKAFKNVNEARKIGFEAEELAADNLIKEIRQRFEDWAHSAEAAFELKSQAYWSDKVGHLKVKTAKTVMESDVLSLEEREELRDVILNFASVSFGDKENLILNKEEFRKKFFGIGHRLDTNKLEKKYKNEIIKMKNDFYNEFKKIHRKNYEGWQTSLEDTVISNIIKLNPKLKRQQELIEEDSKILQELEGKMKDLEMYSAEVNSMIDWKDIEA